MKKMILFALLAVFVTSSLAQQRMMRRIEGDGAFHLKEVQTIFTSKDDTVRVLTVLPKDLRAEGYEEIDLKEKDEILMVNAKRVKTVQEFEQLYKETAVGETLKLGIRRDGRLLLESFEKLAAEDLPKGANIRIRTERVPQDAGDGWQTEEEPEPQALQQEDRDTALRKRVRALESLSGMREEPALVRFAEQHLTESLRKSIAPDELFEMLQKIGRAAAGAAPADDGVRLSFRGSENIDVHFSLEENPPFRIRSLKVEAAESDALGSEELSLAPMTWDNFRERLKQEEEAGFAGTVLIVQDGEIVHHQGYGMANRERGIPNTTDTIFGIGSTPIDFTRAAILKLRDDGKLNLSDPITRFFSGVPSDKTTITVEHLMTGRSGLPNFHHDPERDDDYDLTYIDRDEAVRRILSAPLLFPPGEGESHSHSAFGLLAAVIEIVSGQSYADFLQQRFFDPIGMKHTGFYGRQSGFAAEQFAVGYGHNQAAKLNIPLNWGHTSWLVMGSGGMVSNPGDMYRWVQAIHKGDILSTQSRKFYGSGQVYSGGSDRGFLFVYVDDPDNTVFVASNAHGRNDNLQRAVAFALVQMVTGEQH